MADEKKPDVEGNEPEAEFLGQEEPDTEGHMLQDAGFTAEPEFTAEPDVEGHAILAGATSGEEADEEPDVEGHLQKGAPAAPKGFNAP